MARATKVQITDRKLKALKATGERYEFMDAVVPGFGVRVSEKGARTFIFKTRFPGYQQPARRALGEYPVLSLEEAREKAAEWRKLIKRGIDPAHAQEAARLATVRAQANTFTVVCEAFIADKLPKERKGKEVERDVRREFIPAWDKRPVTEITDVDIITLVKAKARTAPAQARNLLGIAKRLFAWTVDQRTYGLSASPAESLKPTRIIGEKVSRDRVLSDAELFALWRGAGRLSYPHSAAYRLLVLTALRLNEAADASWTEFHPDVARTIRQRKDGEVTDWSRIDPASLLWTIPASRMKGKDSKARAHAVPLTPDVLAILESLPRFKEGNYLFSTNFGKSPAWMSDKVKKRLDARMLLTLRALARRRGDDPATVTLPAWTNHDIRRTVRSGLSRLKIAEEAREAVLAHVRPGIKGTYDHHDYLDEKREALELWAARLRSIIEPAPVNVVPLRAMA